MYRYEVHLHSQACSKCGVSTAREMVQTAADTGYAGVVFTNHFYHGNTRIDVSQPWEAFAGAYRDDYLDAKVLGDELGIDVLYGIEENFGGGHEALIYGIEPDEVVDTPGLAEMTLAELSEFVRSRGGAIFLAHPFRDRAYVTDPYREPEMQYFDGVEAYNLFNTAKTNRMAAEYAKQHGLRIISGGDVHNKVNFGKTGLAFYQRIQSDPELVSALLGGSYKHIIGGRLLTHAQTLDAVLAMRDENDE